MLLSINYVTNFNPQLAIQLKNYPFTFNPITSQYKIMCRNLFLFFLFLKFCFKTKFLKQIKFFIKPHYSNTYTMLRAPYRYKLGRYQFTLNRFFFICSFKIELQHALMLKSTNKLFLLHQICLKFCLFFETNICYVNSIKLRIPFFLNNFFLVKQN